MPGAKWDICAVGLSSVCLVHCLVIAASSALMPFASLHVDNHLLHAVMILMVAPVSFWVVWRVWREGQGTKLFVYAVLGGVSLLILAVAVPAFHHAEVPLTVTGSLMLGAAHLWRWRASHRAPQNLTEEHSL